MTAPALFDEVRSLRVSPASKRRFFFNTLLPSPATVERAPPRAFVAPSAHVLHLSTLNLCLLRRTKVAPFVERSYNEIGLESCCSPFGGETASTGLQGGRCVPRTMASLKIWN